MRQKDRSFRVVAARCLSVILLALLISGCSPEAQTIAPQDLAEYLQRGKVGKVFNLVDLRSQEAFSNLHLPGAINIPYERLAADRLLFLDGLPVIFYDEAEPDLERLKKAIGARLPRNPVET